VVTGIGQSEDGGVQVYVPGESMFIEVQKKNIRLSKDWVGDRWVDLKTIPDILSLVPTNRSPISNETNSESVPISSEQTPIPIDLPEPIETPQEVDPESHEMEVDPVSTHDKKEKGPVSANGMEVDPVSAHDEKEKGPVSANGMEVDPVSAHDEKEKGPVSACDDKDVEMGEK
nr:putative agenet domain-containing protein / bromo-adjacent homology (BAH) domain-containing protein [Tanacetum cinerariifolium]